MNDGVKSFYIRLQKYEFWHVKQLTGNVKCLSTTAQI